jgi:LysR family transcriptional regulator, glycine cleavage system transcriptional activator
MQLPDLDSLRCFEAAAVALNFRRAARAVALSPAAFGERIRRLEQLIGEALFHRTTRSVTLTVAGERLLPRVKRVLEDARRCLGGAQQDANAPYELTIGTRFELGLSWLTPAIEPLSKAVPFRRVHLRFGDSEELVRKVLDGGIDCVISSVRLGNPGLHYELLHQEDYALVATPALLAARPLRTPEDAAQHTLLELHPDMPLFRYFIDARPPGELWSFAAIDHLGAIAAVRYRLLQGAGIAVMPRYFVAPDLQAKRLKEPLPKMKLQHDHFRLIWRAGHRREAELRLLANELRQRPLA